MRRTKYLFAKPAWQVQVVNLLLESLPLADFGRAMTREVLARVLVWMGSACATAADAPRRLGIGVSDETVRKALRASLPPVDRLPALLHASLSEWHRRLRKARKKRGFDVAIDLHHQPYYGKRQPGVVRGHGQPGTRWVWSTATAAIVYRGERLTLAVAPVRSGRMEEVLDQLWPQLQKLRIKVRRLLLDRGFYSARVIDWLQRRRVSFLMPMIRRGRAPRRGDTGSGTAPFFVRGRCGFATYTWRYKRGDRRRVTVQVAMMPHSDRRRRPLVFVFTGRLPNLDYCRRAYKRRFGIETTYRQANQSRAWTTSRDERWRRLLIMLSFVIRNVWVQIQANEPQTPRTDRLTYGLFLTIVVELLQLEMPQTPRGPPHTK